MKRFLIGFAFCFLQLAAFSFCSGDEPVPAHFTEWKAETIVDKSENPDCVRIPLRKTRINPRKP